MNAEFTSSEVCRLTGISHRQLLWWFDTGYLKPAIVPKKIGSGTTFLWPHGEIEKVRLLASVPLYVRHARGFRECIRSGGAFRYILLGCRTHCGNWQAETILHTNNRRKVIRAAAEAQSAVYLIDRGPT